MSYRIKELPEDEKPREKALKYGVASLSNAELLAIILRTGSKNASAVDLGFSLLKEVGGLKGLREAKMAKLSSIRGMGLVKSITLLATVELGRRMELTEDTKIIQIKESQDVYHFYSELFRKEKQEKFLGIFLNSQNIVIHQSILFIGTANQTMVHPRDLFREALLCNAVKILCVHNHPSGFEKPSLEDEKMTQILVRAGEAMKIPVIDHIIIGKNNYYSFLEHGRIQNESK